MRNSINCLMLVFLLYVPHTSCGSLDADNRKAEFPRDSVFLQNKVTHKFSVSDKPDTFMLVLRGTSLKTSIAEFSVISAGGKILYSKQFNATHLKDYGNPPAKDNQNAIDSAILEGFYTFFDEEKFFSPAIEPDVKYDVDNSLPDIDLWKLIQQDSNSIAFHFNGIDEERIMIVYLKKQGKVIEFNP